MGNALFQIRGVFPLGGVRIIVVGIERNELFAARTELLQEEEEENIQDGADRHTETDGAEAFPIQGADLE